MKALKIILVVLVVLAAGLWVARNVLIKAAAKTAIAKTTGFGFDVGSINAGFIGSTFDIRNLKLANPADFPEPQAFDVKEVHVAYDLRSLFTDKVHLREVIVDIPSATMVTKADGESNLQRLQAAAKKREESVEQKPPGQPKAPPPGQPTEKKPTTQIRIDKLTVRLGTVTIHDYSRMQTNGAPFEQVYKINVDETWTDVQDIANVNTLVTTLIFQGIGQEALKRATKVFNDKSFDDAAKSVSGAARDFGKQLEGFFKTPKAPKAQPAPAASP